MTRLRLRLRRGLRPRRGVRLNSKYDDDGDGLIEVSNLEQFNAIRYDLDGNGRPDSDFGAEVYAAAFPTSVGEAVCTSTSTCNGYELTRSLDFDDGDSYASGAVIAGWTSGIGWLPIGIGENRFNSVVDGNGLTISNLYINRTTAVDHPGAVGLFRETGRASVIREIGLVGVDVTGFQGVGGLVGWNHGTISDSHTTGTVSGVRDVGGLAGLNEGAISASYTNGTVSGDGIVGGLAGLNQGTISDSHATGTVSGGFYVGGLVGRNEGTISASYTTGTVLGHSYVGGLAAWNSGAISASYATGNTSGESDVGGLAGVNNDTIRTSYATGNASGGSQVGGLVGVNRETIRASYATGAISGEDSVGGLAGENGGTLIASYATGNVSGGSGVGGLVGWNGGAISASYVTGDVSGRNYVGGLIGSNSGEFVAVSYATGLVSGDSNVGGLIGRNSGTVMGGFWDTQTSGLTTGVGTGDSAGVVGNTTAELQSPTGSRYTGIYSAWEIDFDNADQDFDPMTGVDDYWDFGTSNQYPALKVDFDGDGFVAWQEFGSQVRARPTLHTHSNTRRLNPLELRRQRLHPLPHLTRRQRLSSRQRLILSRLPLLHLSQLQRPRLLPHQSLRRHPSPLLHLSRYRRRLQYPLRQAQPYRRCRPQRPSQQPRPWRRSLPSRQLRSPKVARAGPRQGRCRRAQRLSACSCLLAPLGMVGGLKWRSRRRREDGDDTTQG